jgi:hypothetical protein
MAQLDAPGPAFTRKPDLLVMRRLKCGEVFGEPAA